MPSAYLQKRFHSGERVVARGPLVFFFVKSVFTNPSILRSIFSDRYTIVCANAFVIYIFVVTLEPPLIHFF